ncbi:hypothetical protein AX777_10840 [Sphingobium yanoikuyae]|jgi:hypothetical protein|uniref:Uncharacterized protein n=1 Tax=Sphingobium yanoikuyae TaxID=13690 RepID=A0A177JSL8_SPHYA|nr:hypothetical protein [Sphingobium yanoikuyae]OAH43315.1 hypothetical protein AX777_10840 [Sphingobium yanoikuyae]
MPISEVPTVRSIPPNKPDIGAGRINFIKGATGHFPLSGWPLHNDSKVLSIGRGGDLLHSYRAKDIVYRQGGRICRSGDQSDGRKGQ